MDPISKLCELFGKFPGIGPRQAKRFMYFILKSDNQFIDNLQETITSLRSNIRQCEFCLRYFIPQKNDGATCKLCVSPLNKKSILIIEKDIDLENIHKSGAYNGYYFIIGGLLPILEKEPETLIRINELNERLRDNIDITEVILALSASPLGDNTVDYLKIELANLGRHVKVSSLGRGLSTGAELEYSDHHTLAEALKNRG